MANYLYFKGALLCYNLRIGANPTAMYLANVSSTLSNGRVIVYELLIQYDHLDTYPLHKKNVTDEDCLDESGIEAFKDRDYEIFIQNAKIIKADSTDSNLNKGILKYPDFKQVRITIYEDWNAPKFITAKDTDEETMKLLIEVKEE